MSEEKIVEIPQTEQVEEKRVRLMVTTPHVYEHEKMVVKIKPTGGLERMFPGQEQISLDISNAVLFNKFNQKIKEVPENGMCVFTLEIVNKTASIVEFKCSPLESITQIPL